MTGRELILYILENGLENEQVVHDGKLIGFLTVDEAAVLFNVGTATISVWVLQKKLPSVVIGNTIYIPALCTMPSNSVIA